MRTPLIGNRLSAMLFAAAFTPSCRRSVPSKNSFFSQRNREGFDIEKLDVFIENHTKHCNKKFTFNHITERKLWLQQFRNKRLCYKCIHSAAEALIYFISKVALALQSSKRRQCRSSISHYSRRALWATCRGRASRQRHT